MKLPSTIIALFASLFLIGCATKQATPAQTQNDPTKKWEKKENQY
jgi:outer membrane biogenesis lipoprotein LolB